MSSIRISPSKDSSLVTKYGYSSNKLYVNKKVTSDLKSNSEPNVIRPRSSPYIYLADGEFSIVWSNVTVFIIGHLCWAYALYLVITLQVQWMTFGYCEFNSFRYFLLLKKNIFLKLNEG